jgi:Uma2 family endonuclease
MSAAARMTAQDYFAVTEVGDRKQLVDGAIVVNDPRLDHGLVQTNLLTELTNWARAEPGRGVAFPPTDVVVDEHNVYGPDVSWVSGQRLPELVAGELGGLPDIAVEVRSESTWRYDTGAKKAAYERAGLRELWLVDTRAQTVLVLRRSRDGAPAFDVALELAGDDELTSPQLPGFRVAVERLFRP